MKKYYSFVVVRFCSDEFLVESSDELMDNDELIMHSLMCYFGIHFPCCFPGHFNVGNKISGALTWKQMPLIFYKKFHSPKPIFHSPSSKCTRIGERAGISFPDCT